MFQLLGLGVADLLEIRVSAVGVVRVLWFLGAEYFTCLCRVACQSGRPYGPLLGAVVGQLLGGEAARVDGVVGLLPFALAVPEGAGVSDGDNLRVLDAKLRYYTHIADPDSLNDTEWAMMVKELEWVRKKRLRRDYQCQRPQ